MSNDFRFVHAADIHLDTPYQSQSEELRRELADAGRDTFSALVDLAIEEQVHALLIAGDLFDNDRLTFRTEDVLLREVARACEAGVTVVYATGNHDPGRANYRAFKIGWPTERFRLIRSRAPEVIEIRDEDGEVVGHVVGAGHQTQQEGDNLAALFPPAPGPEPAVAVLHAQIDTARGAEQHDRYAPCTVEDFIDKGYQYWALGHVHERQQVHADPVAWYPGNLQGRHFRETGAKGALLVTIRQGVDPVVEFRPLAPVRWELLRLDGLDAVASLAGLHSAARAAFETLQRDSAALNGQRWMLRFEMSGPCPIAEELRQSERREELEDAFQNELNALGVQICDIGVHRPLDLDEHRGQPHLLGIVIEVLEEFETDDELLDRIAPEHLAGAGSSSDAHRRAYLRRRAARLDMEAAETLLRPMGQ